METVTVLRSIEVTGVGELKLHRNDYDNGDQFAAIAFYPRPASSAELAGGSYRPLSYYHVAWARLPRRGESGPVTVLTNHNVGVMLGMAAPGTKLPELSVQKIEDLEPVLEFIGRAFALAFDARRRGGAEALPAKA